jgi:hypothetical protein
VTNLYLRDSLLIDVITTDQTRRETGFTHTDQIGKVFAVVGQDLRKCLVCEQFFTRRAASEHARVPCTYGTKVQPVHIKL